MKYYSKVNVFDAALDRIRWLFDEFPNVICGISGGKDSTVVFNLTLQVARERGRLPLKCMFVDQEAEWSATIDLVRSVMENPDVEPLWLQIPIKLFNATSATDHWLYCWDANERHRWMREQEPYAITENRYGTDRFVEMFKRFLAVDFRDQKTCYIAGVRTEESPGRFTLLTTNATYKWATWGTQLNKRLGHYTFYPIYDWSFTDVWKAIHSEGWEYNRIYDAMYCYGVPVEKMRVSNVHHETSVHSLFYLQEVEPATYQKLTERIAGIDSAAKLGAADFFVKELPFMFADWAEYRDYLLEQLIDNDEWKAGWRAAFQKHETLFAGTEVVDRMRKVHVSSILTNDWEHIKLFNFDHSPDIYNLRRRLQGKAHWAHRAGRTIKK